jgi:hypothetical protein
MKMENNSATLDSLTKVIINTLNVVSGLDYDVIAFKLFWLTR